LALGPDWSSNLDFQYQPFLIDLSHDGHHFSIIKVDHVLSLKEALDAVIVAKQSLAVSYLTFVLAVKRH